MARRGTEAFPDLGAHCDREDCNQLDFLPFDCDGCGKVFCAEHRTYRDHGCARAADQGRTIVVCEACGDAIERKAGETEGDILEAHARSRRCDPARKRKPRCPVRGCKETLTFSNTSDCKGCGQKVCLKHRFPTAHKCTGVSPAGAAAARRAGQCGRDGLKKEGGERGGWVLPHSLRNFKSCMYVVKAQAGRALRGFFLERRKRARKWNKTARALGTCNILDLLPKIFFVQLLGVFET